MTSLAPSFGPQPATPRTPRTARTALTPRRRNTIDGSPSSNSSTPRKAGGGGGSMLGVAGGGGGGIKQLMTIEQFQARHAAYFAHLHEVENEDSNIRGGRLAEEQARLDEERRIGREKRQQWEKQMAALSKAMGDRSLGEGDKENRPASVAGERSAWRPLSLLSKKVVGGHTRSASHDVPSRPTASIIFGELNPNRSGVEEQEEPVDLFTPTSKRVVTPMALTRTSKKPLDVVVEHSPVPSPSPEISGAKSTYSWATEFSGETAELRTAAQYVRRKSYDEEEMLDSPTKAGQQRKRIVALAHTVRQLEGVGSRDAEDPNFYQVLVKAWHGRNDDPVEETPATYPPASTGNALTDAPPPFLAPLDDSIGPVTHFSDPSESETSTTIPIYNRSSGSFSPTFQNSFSPAEASIITPAMPDMGFLPQPYSALAESSSAAKRDSSRYSYASTLHDLALEGGIRQGENLMGEKAWMKSRAVDGRWSNMFNARPPEDFFPPGSRRPPSISPMVQDVPEEDEVDRQIEATPQRPLRKYATDVALSRPSHTNQLSPGATPRAAPQSTGWGLGFMGNWWSASSTPDPSIALEPPSQAEGEEDFHMGEDGTSLTNCPNFADTPPALPDIPPPTALYVPLAEEAPRTSPSPSSTRESSPFSADLEAAADASSISATDLNSATIGLAITTSAPVLASSVSALILAPLANMSLPGRRAQPQPEPISEYPSSNPYPPRKSLIHSPTSCPQASDPIGDALPLPRAATYLSPLDRLTNQTQAQMTQSHQEDCSDSSATGSSQSPPSLQQPHPHQLPPLSMPTNLPPQLLHAPSPSPSSEEGETFNGSPTSPDIPLVPLAPYNTISSSTTTTNRTDTPSTGGESSLSPCQSDSRCDPNMPPFQRNHPTITQHQLANHQESMRRTNQRDAHHLLATSRPLSSGLLDCQNESDDTLSSPTPAGEAERAERAQAAVASAPATGEVSASPNQHLPFAQVEVALARKPRARSTLPRTMFFLGWIMPWCWIFGGWPLAPSQGDIEQGNSVLKAEKMQGQGEGWWRQWMYHPDPWARRCRVGAVVVLPSVTVLAIAAVIVLAILR